jgi:hypothetical protein
MKTIEKGDYMKVIKGIHNKKSGEVIKVHRVYLYPAYASRTVMKVEPFRTSSRSSRNQNRASEAKQPIRLPEPFSCYAYQTSRSRLLALSDQQHRGYEQYNVFQCPGERVSKHQQQASTVPQNRRSPRQKIRAPKGHTLPPPYARHLKSPPSFAPKPFPGCL